MRVLAVDHLERGLGIAEHLAETNSARRPREAQPAALAAQGLHIAATGQVLHDLHQVIA